MLQPQTQHLLGSADPGPIFSVYPISLWGLDLAHVPYCTPAALDLLQCPQCGPHARVLVRPTYIVATHTRWDGLGGSKGLTDLVPVLMCPKPMVSTSILDRETCPTRAFLCPKIWVLGLSGSDTADWVLMSLTYTCSGPSPTCGPQRHQWSCHSV
jgi:hypothetical protein